MSGGRTAAAALHVFAPLILLGIAVFAALRRRKLAA